MSMSTCVAHFNSMLTATFPLRLVKMMEKGMREGDCGNTDAGKEGEDRSSIAECPWGSCLCSHQIQRCLVCTGKRREENGMDCTGKHVDVYNYCTAVSCTHWYVKESVLYLIRLEMGTHCRDHRTRVICFETSFWSQYVQQHSGSFAGDSAC